MSDISVLESVDGLSNTVRILQKIDSMLIVGHVIDAHRTVNALIAQLLKNKQELFDAVRAKEKRG